MPITLNDQQKLMSPVMAKRYFQHILDVNRARVPYVVGNHKALSAHDRLNQLQQELKKMKYQVDVHNRALFSPKESQPSLEKLQSTKDNLADLREAASSNNQPGEKKSTAEKQSSAEFSILTTRLNELESLAQNEHVPKEKQELIKQRISAIRERLQKRRD
ncbi:MAG: hypothetical protein ACMXYF_04095 [Candidatus Woesearchaeota archaeon]